MLRVAQYFFLTILQPLLLLTSKYWEVPVNQLGRYDISLAVIGVFQRLLKRRPLPPSLPDVERPAKLAWDEDARLRVALRGRSGRRGSGRRRGEGAERAAALLPRGGQLGGHHRGPGTVRERLRQGRGDVILRGNDFNYSERK